MCFSRRERYELIRLLSLLMRSSNIAVVFIPTGTEEERTRLFKPFVILDRLDPDDPNVFYTNFIDRYANQPDDSCSADFAAHYKSTNGYR